MIEGNPFVNIFQKTGFSGCFYLQLAYLSCMTIEKIIEWLEAHHMPLRVLLSVVAGIATSMILSLATHEVLHLAGFFPPLNKPLFVTKLVVIELIFHSFYALIGACITAKYAQDKARKAVFFLGTKEAIMWLVGTLLLWHHSPPWYNLSKAVLGVPLALLGGYLYKHYLKKPDPQPKKGQA